MPWRPRGRGRPAPYNDPDTGPAPPRGQPMDQVPAPEAPPQGYQRVVLKLSGEGFGLRGKSGISIDETLSIARQAQRVVKSGVQLAIVVGGGNILRGAQFSAGGEVIKESTAHYMGMLATVLNGLALQDT